MTLSTACADDLAVIFELNNFQPHDSDLERLAALDQHQNISGICTVCDDPISKDKKALARRANKNPSPVCESCRGNNVNQRALTQIFSTLLGEEAITEDRSTIRGDDGQVKVVFDAVFPRHMIFLEIDGRFHREKLYKDQDLDGQQHRDRSKNRYAEDRPGWRMIRFEIDDYAGWLVNAENFRTFLLADGSFEHSDEAWRDALGSVKLSSSYKRKVVDKVSEIGAAWREGRPPRGPIDSRTVLQLNCPKCIGQWKPFASSIVQQGAEVCRSCAGKVASSKGELIMFADKTRFPLSPEDLEERWFTAEEKIQSDAFSCCGVRIITRVRTLRDKARSDRVFRHICPPITGSALQQALAGAAEVKRELGAFNAKTAGEFQKLHGGKNYYEALKVIRKANPEISLEVQMAEYMPTPHQTRRRMTELEKIAQLEEEFERTGKKVPLARFPYVKAAKDAFHGTIKGNLSKPYIATLKRCVEGFEVKQKTYTFTEIIEELKVYADSGEPLTKSKDPKLYQAVHSQKKRIRKDPDLPENRRRKAHLVELGYWKPKKKKD